MPRGTIPVVREYNDHPIAASELEAGDVFEYDKETTPVVGCMPHSNVGYGNLVMPEQTGYTASVFFAGPPLLLLWIRAVFG